MNENETLKEVLDIDERLKKLFESLSGEIEEFFKELESLAYSVGDNPFLTNKIKTLEERVNEIKTQTRLAMALKISEIDKSQLEKRESLLALPRSDPSFKVVTFKRRRISRVNMFGWIVQVVAERSPCIRAQVGALIVKDSRIISIGYNGPASGIPNCTQPSPSHFPTECEGPGCTRSIHAETNAIAFAAKFGIPIEGATLYCSMSPCLNCAKQIANSGIKEVYYLENYRDSSGLNFLHSLGIKTYHLDLGESNE